MSSTSQLKPNMVSPKNYKYEDSTLIFDKTEPDHHRFKNHTYQSALVLHANQSLDKLQSNITEINPVRDHEFRANKILIQQKKQIDNLKKKVQNITNFKVNNVEKTSDLEKLFMD
jgi:hypothetical protein